ncbi:protein-disulfide reductase DsbD family protein [Alphaproteobacteria bacterium]|nr:protein-disulfide reductase DsbD family protein [Alphaproteobacteria bacterium]
MRTVLFTFTLLIFALPSYAEEAKNIRMSLIDHKEKSKDLHKASMNIELDEGWHTYAMNPGEVGLPPRFEWLENSKNVGSVSINYPKHEEFEEFGFKVNGYKNEATFPIYIHPKDESLPVTFDLTAYIMICNEICIPETLHAMLEIQP